MENQTAPAANQPTGPTLAIQSVYLKDCSYEAPKGPRIDSASWNPQISLDLNTSVNTISPEVNEVVLTVTVGAKQGEATAFLVEVKQAGLGVYVWTVNSADDARHLADIGIEGITTDRPGWLREQIETSAE